MQYKKTENDPNDVFAGAKLRNVRCLKSMSQEKLAEHVGVTFQQIQKYESGNNRMSVSRLHKICEVLGVHPAVFFHGYDGSVQDDGLSITPDEIFFVNCLRKSENSVRNAVKLLLKAHAHPHMSSGRVVETKASSKQELDLANVLRPLGRIPGKPNFLTSQEAMSIYKHYRDVIHKHDDFWKFHSENSGAWKQAPDGSWTRKRIFDSAMLHVKPDGCTIVNTTTKETLGV